MKLKSAITAIAILAATASLSQAAVFVQWGVDGGQTDIVSANQAMNVLATTTYDAGTKNSPDVGANYYPTSTGRSPVFYAAGSASDGTTTTTLDARQVLDNAVSDRLRLSENSANNPLSVHGMVAWQSPFLSGQTTIDSFTIQAFDGSSGAAVSTQRFLFETGGNWFASQTFALTGGFTTQGGNVSAMSWFDFTPISNGVATIGTSATGLTFANVTSVGYYFENTATTTGVQMGSFTQYFQATTVPEPSIFGLLALGMFGIGLLRRRRRK